MWRASRSTIALSVFVSGREVVIWIAFFCAVAKTVAGGLSPRSKTRLICHFSVSRANGGSWYQPWLATVRLKLKLRGVGILSSIDGGHSNNLRVVWSLYRSRSVKLNLDSFEDEN